MRSKHENNDFTTQLKPVLWYVTLDFECLGALFTHLCMVQYTMYLK